jgi:hypothetical protein
LGGLLVADHGARWGRKTPAYVIPRSYCDKSFRFRDLPTTVRLSEIGVPKFCPMLAQV